VRRSASALDAFGTPTIVHFGTVLLLAAIMTTPWHALLSAALGIGAVGLGGLLYGAIVLRRARMQSGYKPVLEDWLWHTAFPLLVHTVLVASAIALSAGRLGALIPIAAASLFLLFIGIHNSWDTVVFIVVDDSSQAPRPTEVSESPQPEHPE